MPWSDLPDPVPPMTPREWLAAVFARLGCVGVVGLLVFAFILGVVAHAPESAVAP